IVKSKYRRENAKEDQRRAPRGGRRHRPRTMRELLCIVQVREGLLDLPLPARAPLELKTLAKRAPGLGFLIEPQMERAKLEQGLGVGLIEHQDPLDPLPCITPASLKIGLHRIAKEPVDLAAVPVGMAEPDPP